MNKAVDLRFKDEEQMKAFADACQQFIDINGHFPFDQIIIFSVIDAVRYQKERDESRAEYQLLLQQYNHVCKKNRELEKKLKEAKQTNNQRRA